MSSKSWSRPSAAALRVEQEAAAVYRQLAAADPDHYRPELAELLTNLGARLLEVGCTADAVPVTEEAIAIFRQLAVASPDRYRPTLARPLTNLGGMLLEVGRAADAVPVAEEAVAIFRELAAASADRYGSDLASSLDNLGIVLYAVGRAADAVAVTEECVAINRELAAASSDRYRPDLARSLTNLGTELLEVGRAADAVPVAEEAVAIFRELAAASADRYGSDLASSLDNLGIVLYAVDRAADAVPVTEECVAIYRQLAAEDPVRYRLDVAQSLANLGVTLSEIRRLPDALSAHQEAATIYRELAAAYPGRYRVGLARVLDNLAEALMVLDRHIDAEAVRDEVANLSEHQFDDLHYTPSKYSNKISIRLSTCGRIYSKYYPYLNDAEWGTLVEGASIRRTLLIAWLRRLSPLFFTSVLMCLHRHRHNAIERSGLAVSVFVALLYQLPYAVKVMNVQVNVRSAAKFIGERADAIRSSHERALRTLRKAVDSNSRFALTLGSYEITAMEKDFGGPHLPDNWSEKNVDFYARHSRGRSVLSFTATPGVPPAQEEAFAELLSAKLPVIGIRNNAGFITEDSGRLPRIFLMADTWRPQVTEMIRAARLIVMHVSSLTPGVKFEFETILNLGKADSTLVVVTSESQANNPFVQTMIEDIARTYRLQQPERAHTDWSILSEFPHVVTRDSIVGHTLIEIPELANWFGEDF